MVWFRRLGLGLFAVWTLFPIYWLIITALKGSEELRSYPPSFVPGDPTLEQFSKVFETGFMGDYLRNSIFIVTISVTVAMVTGCFAAYALTRGKLPRGVGAAASGGTLGVRMLPPIVLIVPVYLMVLKVGLTDSYLGLALVIAAFNLPIVIWMMRSFLQDIPADIEEAALTDGASRFRALRTVVLPVVAPGLAATAIITGILTYNEFVYGLVLTSTPDTQPVTVGIATFLGKIQTDYGGLAAAGVVAVVPVLIFALIVQRYLIRGLTAGSVK